MGEPNFTADFVIVGAGSAGCVLANRLSEDATHSVLVLEAGNWDRNPLFAIPLAARWLWFDKRYNWNYVSEPEPGLNGRRIMVPRGKVIGGSSSINGMIYSRGHPRDYDQWRQTGLTGWGFADVLPYFKRAETNDRGETDFHGGDGPLQVMTYPAHTLEMATVLKSAEAAGFETTEDFHGAKPEGFGPPDYTVGSRLRSSAARAYLRPALERKNVQTLTGAQVFKVEIENGRATGIRFRQNGREKFVAAKRDVILSGGAINSPQLLMLSGIGEAAALQQHGITPVLDRPAVGKNLQDHLSVLLRMKAGDKFGFENELRFDRLTGHMLNWVFRGKGPVRGMPLSAMGYVRTRPGLDRPDVQFFAAPVAPEAGPWFPGIKKRAGHQLVFRVVDLHPDSRGQIDLASSDPMEPVKIFHNYLGEEADLITRREGVKAARRVLSQSPMADDLLGELEPGPGVQSDEEIDNFIRETGSTLYHPVGTCRMGADQEAVVDGDLKVRGIEGLRVVDASVMPFVNGGNTNAPTIMIAEKAADAILGKPPLARAEVPDFD